MRTLSGMRINLKTVLTANAAFSALSGVVLAAGSAPIADFADTPTWVPLVVGAGLLPFAALVLTVARSEPLPRPAVQAVLAADIAWVVGAALLIVAGPTLLSTGGKVALAAVSLVVADFAILEAIGLRQLEASAPRRPSTRPTDVAAY